MKANISVILIQGGLGNQMFGYAFLQSLKKLYPLSLFFIEVSESVNSHCGLEIFKVFNIKEHWRYKSGISRMIKKHAVEIEQKNALQFDNSQTKDRALINFYSGYWQSEKFFFGIRDIIRKKYTFNYSMISHINIETAIAMKKNNSVSIHVRRGDYININATHSFDISYYEKAINYIKQNVSSPVFYLFSDDTAWCKKQQIFQDANIIDWNTGKNSWQDMFLMSNCKHNIIANSTFSWWGAWLNNNKNKIVITPKQWFVGVKENDIIPTEWIRF